MSREYIRLSDVFFILSKISQEGNFSIQEIKFLCNFV